MKNNQKFQQNEAWDKLLASTWELVEHIQKTVVQPFQLFLGEFAEVFPWWVCEQALETAEDGDIETFDWFAREYLKLYPSRWTGDPAWPYAEEALRESLKSWRLADEPLHYIEKVAHKKRTWAELDVDNVSGGRFYPGSLFTKRKDRRNKDPRNILSLDVMLEMEGRRAENDKETWLDNDGIIENEQNEVIVTGEADRLLELEDPYETSKGKKSQWIKEAEYIQAKFAKGYHTKTFTMKDEQEKFIMSSFIPRLKRKGADPNLSYRIEERVDANVDMETAIKMAGLKNDDVIVAKAWGLRPGEKYFDGAEWNQYRSGWFQVHMAAPDIAILLKWDEKRVNASMKRIKRAVKSNKLYL